MTSLIRAKLVMTSPLCKTCNIQSVQLKLLRTPSNSVVLQYDFLYYVIILTIPIIFYLYTQHSGVVTRRWRTLTSDMSCDIELALLANHIQVNNEQRAGISLTEEMVVIVT